MEFDQKYFENYCGNGAYEDNFQEHSGIAQAMKLAASGVISNGRVCVLGAATGEVMKYIFDKSQVMPAGCEISQWAHRKIPRKFRAATSCLDMRDYLKRQVEKCERYSLVFSNSLFYLPERSLESVLGYCKELSDHIYFEPEAWPDPRVRIQQPYEWWQIRFNRVGFESHADHQYLWSC